MLTCLIAEDPEHLAVGEMWLRVERGELGWYFDPPNDKAPAVVRSSHRDTATTTCARNELSDGSAATLCLSRGGALVGLDYLGLHCGSVYSGVTTRSSNQVSVSQLLNAK